MSAIQASPLVELQQTLYSSGNYTRRRLHRDRLRRVAGAVTAHAPKAPIARAIEYGPGSGIYLPILIEQFPAVVAADIEKAYLDGIRPLTAAYPGLEVTVDDIQDSCFDDGSFGLVLCSEVLEHVVDPERSLMTLYRILHPGGIAIVTTPQRYSTMELCCKVAFLPGVIDLVRAIYQEPILPTGHISLRTRGAFRRAIGAAGFEILEQSRFGLYIPGVAEFCGDWGGAAIESLEHRLRGTPVESLFWTQAYVMRKPSA
jgi:SAM-dependent methyltransferase